MPGREWLALRNCGEHMVWLRELLKEMNLGFLVEKPTVIECDSKGAIDWVKFGKITAGNRSFAVSYDQAMFEWQDEGQLYYLKIPGMFNRSDITTKAISVNDLRRLLMWAMGYASEPDLDPAISDLNRWEEHLQAWQELLSSDIMSGPNIYLQGEQD